MIFKRFYYLTSASIVASMAMIQVGQAMNIEYVLQKSESALSNLSLITDDSKDYLDNLNATKSHLQEKIEHHRTKFTESVPNRRVMTKQLKRSPQATYDYSCGIHLLKDLAKVEKEIDFIQKSRKGKTQVVSYTFLNNLQNGINLLYEHSAESLTQALHKRSHYTSEIKHPWLWGWMAFSITLQALSVPACAHLQQTHPNNDIKIDPEKFICPSIPINETHKMPLRQNQPAKLGAPVFVPPVISPFVYPTPSLAANAKVIGDMINCFWDQKSAQKTRGAPSCCADSVHAQVPDYSNLAIWNEWYDDFQLLAHARGKIFLTTVIREGREKIPPKSKIVILASSVKAGQLIHGTDMINYCWQLSILSNFKGKPIVGYWPEFYSVYWGDDLRTTQWKDFMPTNLYPHLSLDRRVLCSEMEYIDKNISFYDRKNWEHVPDNIVFEKDLGEWASYKIAKVSHGDDNGRHNLLANIDYYRAYHIGIDTYLFKLV